MGVPLLNDIVVISGLAIGILCICHRLKIPAVVGFLITGMLAGPHGLGFIRAVDDVEILAQIGIVFLLFTIGIEFSLKSLFDMKRPLLVGGSIQVFVTILLVFIVAAQLGKSFGSSVFLGFLIALSSTAIVLKIMQDKAQISSPHGRQTLAILIFQDLIVVPMILLTPILAGKSESVLQSLLLLLAKGLALITFIVAFAEWGLPRLMFRIVKTRNRELFMLSLVGICLAIAWLSASLGLSLALGAFLAGLTISRSQYSHQALSSIFPFRDVFTSFFFISVGMLLDLRILAHQPVLILVITIGVLLFKSMIAGSSVIMLGFPLKTAILSGLALSQVGEFSFILAQMGVLHGLLGGNTYQIFLAVSIMTMIATPFLISVSPKIADRVLKLPFPEGLKSGLRPLKENVEEHWRDRLKDHLVIVGFGVNGRNLSSAAKLVGIPYIIVDLNPQTVREELAKGQPIFYGDASQEPVLEYASIKVARVLVLAIPDPAATRRIAALARKLNPSLHIVARTLYQAEVGPLYDLGADEVIPQEFEASIEIFTRVLTKYLIPKDQIESFVSEVRRSNYDMFRSMQSSSASLNDLKIHLPNIEISALRVQDRSPIIAKSLSEIELRRKYGITLVAIRRGAEVLSNPDASTKLCADDILILIGPPEKIAGVTPLFYNA